MFGYRVISSFQDNDIALYDKVYHVTDSINQYYPNHRSWYYNTFLPGLKANERFIVCCIDEQGKIIGVALLKKTKSENKICCLFVMTEYQQNGIGSSLIEKSFECLGDNKPLLTVSEANLPKLEKLLKKYGFALSGIKINEYMDGEKEYYFN